MRILFTVLQLFATCCSSVLAHSDHSQVTEVEWNSVSGRFEIAMKLRAVAVEDSVSAQKRKRFRLESSRSADAILSEWMEKTFHIGTGNASQAGKIRWAGHELKLHTLWLYFEYLPFESEQFALRSSPPRQSRYRKSAAVDICIENKCLLNAYPETIHLVKLRYGQSVLQAHCSQQQPVADFSRSQIVTSRRVINHGTSAKTRNE